MWNFLYHHLRSDLPKDCKFSYIGRPESVSPAMGSNKISTEQQTKLLKCAFL